MHQVRVLVALTVAVALGSGASAAINPMFVGNWYGIGEPDDPNIFYIDSYSADGTFHSEYRKCEKGKLIYSQTQSGRWSVANGVLTMNSDVVDGKPQRFDHSYTIESLTQNEFHARYHNPDYLFVEKRIPAFEFPPCYLGA